MASQAKVRKVSPAEAEAVMQAAGLTDVTGFDTPSTIARKGEAFELTTAGGQGVFVIERKGRKLWIHGAGGVASSGLTGDGLELIEAIARQAQCEAVAFQTGRPGLARLAKKAGYRVTGFILEKSI